MKRTKEVKIMQVNKLKSRIVEAGYTQKSLAKAMGISKNTLNSKINGKTQFNLKEVDTLCELLAICAPEEKAQIFLICSSQ